jgi:predicted TIM-barrel fold metal-dependent hydrolase
MTDFDRRSFLSGAVASLGMAATGSLGLSTLFAQEGAFPKPYIIDIHHHFAPPAWLAVVQGLGSSAAPLQAANVNWTPAKSIEDMNLGGVAAALVSITNPGLWFGDKAVTNRVARACNEYGAKLVQDYPGRFGLFAAMPLPDVDATLKEIAYAYDTLKADGVGLFTSYGDTWLGNPAYRPVMEELNRRKAVVHVHPTAADCCRNLTYAPGVSAATMEYGTDTTRAIIGVTVSGDAARFPDIRFIWSHAGGTVPFLAGRIAGSLRNLKDGEQRLPNGFMYELKKFYYDVAGAANPGAIASLMKLVTSSQVLFGTDFPPAGTSRDISKSLDQLGFSEADRRAIDRGNAVRLLPRFNV